MAEPKTRAERIEPLFPWLLHWSLSDDRIGGFRSDAYAVRSPEGLVLIDPLPFAPALEAELEGAVAILLTHGSHQRSAWRLRRELGAPVHAPAGAAGLDEEPDARFDASTPLPGGLRAIEASGFEGACYLAYTHSDGTGVLFCGDLICQDPGGPYRFPVQEGYFDPAAGREDARRLLALPTTVLCPAHAAPTIDGSRAALEGALQRG